jgi:hypothetical protein
VYYGVKFDKKEMPERKSDKYDRSNANNMDSGKKLEEMEHFNDDAR